MAQYYGPVSVPISSWSAFKNATLGNWYDVDRAYGAQCVDYFKLLNYNLGYPLPYAETGTFGYAYEMWTDPVSRAFNASDKYDYVTNYRALRRGDMIILNANPNSAYGHNAIVDSDPIINPPEMAAGTYYYLVGQNQELPSATQGHEVTRNLFRVDQYFLGAFRLKAWNQGPSPITRRSHFPWYMITRKKLTKRK